MKLVGYKIVYDTRVIDRLALCGVRQWQHNSASFVVFYAMWRSLRQYLVCLYSASSNTHQTDPSDDGDDLTSLIELEDLKQREADGDRKRLGVVQHRSTFDAVLLVVLQQHSDEPLLRGRFDGAAKQSGRGSLAF